MRDSTIEKLLNGETTDLFDMVESEEIKTNTKEIPAAAANIVENELDLNNTEEL
jgi:hypothetical protein